ncbi:19884_t:CDS:2, partial [Entrophospora sp. SA101]
GKHGQENHVHNDVNHKRHKDNVDNVVAHKGGFDPDELKQVFVETGLLKDVEVEVAFRLEDKDCTLEYLIARGKRDGLPFEDNSFDFVHIRSLFYDFTESQWMNIIYKETLRVLKPGGWLEIADPETRAYNTGPLTDFLLKSISKDVSLRNISSCIVDSHDSNLRTIISNNKNINEQKEKIVIHHDKKLYQIGNLKIIQ